MFRKRKILQERLDAQNEITEAIRARRRTSDEIKSHQDLIATADSIAKNLLKMREYNHYSDRINMAYASRRK